MTAQPCDVPMTVLRSVWGYYIYNKSIMPIKTEKKTVDLVKRILHKKSAVNFV